MNYLQTVNYLYNRLPVYQKIGNEALKPGLNGISKFCEYLGNPQNSFRSIHIAGTNGKGSSSHMIASILASAGYNTGLYTSPHLLDFRERIRQNGKKIPKKFVIDFIKNHKHFIESNDFSFFEVTVALCFYFFSKQKIDIAVIEVGLGGRLDSTNIISPIISLITNISYDHKAILGDTLEKIAIEKAGIIKKNTPLVVSNYQKEVEHVFIKTCQELEAELYFASEYQQVTNINLTERYREIQVLNAHSGKHRVLRLDLLGNYQLQNVVGVLEAIEQFNKLGLDIRNEHIASGLANVVKNTQLMGRWQRISSKPTIICDTGHNEDGLKQVVENLSVQNYRNLHMVIGFANDKDVDQILRLLPQNAIYYFCKANIDRALDSKILLKSAKNINLKGTHHPSVVAAYHFALENAQKTDLIFVGGSTFVVADLLIFFKTSYKQPKWGVKN
jgi:dihydrofolate synthase / folylpolyglutamate synthase